MKNIILLVTLSTLFVGASFAAKNTSSGAWTDAEIWGGTVLLKQIVL